jgi:hypothetical protein
MRLEYLPININVAFQPYDSNISDPKLPHNNVLQQMNKDAEIKSWPTISICNVELIGLKTVMITGPAFQ